MRATSFKFPWIYLAIYFLFVACIFLSLPFPTGAIFNLLSAKSGHFHPAFLGALIFWSASYIGLVCIDRVLKVSYFAARPLFRTGIFLMFLAVVATTFWCYQKSSTFANPVGALEGRRFSLDALIDKEFSLAFKEIKRVGSNLLPNQIHFDNIKEGDAAIAGTIQSNLIFLDRNAEQKIVSKNIFYGWLLWIQGLQEAQFLSIVSHFLIAIGILALVTLFYKSRLVVVTALTTITSLSVFLSIRLSEGWDEFFINLRHAFMLAHHGVYSINSSNLIEATVDLFPLLFTALLGMAGVDLVDGFLLTSLIGNTLVIFTSYAIVFSLTKDCLWALFGGLVVGLYPNVIWVGGTGFTAVLFSGWILAGCYFYALINRRYLGLFFLSTLTLIRTEGILFSFLILLFIFAFNLFIKNRKDNFHLIIKRYLIDGLVISLPFIVSSLIRKSFFGYFVPIPMLFKSTGFDKNYFASGMDRLSHVISSHDIHLMLVFVVFLVVGNLAVRGLRNSDKLPNSWKILLLLNLIAVIFITPYYMGGGDWFSYRWNRYGMPFNLILYLTILVYFYGLFSSLLKGWKKTLALSIFLFSISLGYVASAKSQKNNIFFSTFLDLLNPSQVRWDRVDNLAELGVFLRKYLPTSAVVASPEEATIMYFSQRDMVGLLGVSNPIIANMPLQPFSPGDILHRKRAIDAIYITRPDVIAVWEPVLKKKFEENSALGKNIGNALQAEVFEGGKVDVAYYRIGSYQYLEDLGYRHIAVVMQNSLYSLFINDKIFNMTMDKLNGDGFKGVGTYDIKYSVSPWLPKIYAPSANREGLK